MADAQQVEDKRYYTLTPKEFDLLERLICVEQELKAQRDLMQMMQHNIDKQFEAMQHNIDKRLEQIEKRLAFMQWTIGLGFTLLSAFMALMRFFPQVPQ